MKERTKGRSVGAAAMRAGIHRQERLPEEDRTAASRALRTFQRRVEEWRRHHGPPKEVFFPQATRPGEWMQVDWTHADELGVTIQCVRFDHLLAASQARGRAVFRQAYDALARDDTSRASLDYVDLLGLAAVQGETRSPPRSARPSCARHGRELNI